jgi:hypothetical protein
MRPKLNQFAQHHERDALRAQQIRSLSRRIDRGLRQLDIGQGVSAGKAWKQMQVRRKRAARASMNGNSQLQGGAIGQTKLSNRG